MASKHYCSNVVGWQQIMTIFTTNRVIKTLLLVAAILFLDGSGRIVQWYEEHMGYLSSIERESAFEILLLNTYERNVVYEGQGRPDFGYCGDWKPVESDGLSAIIDLDDRSNTELFRFRCQDQDRDIEDQVVLLTDIFYESDEEYNYATFEINIPDIVLKNPHDREYYWRSNRFVVGKIRWDLSDESVKNGLLDAAKGIGKNWFELYVISGEMELSELYRTGNDVVRRLIKLFIIFSFMASTFLALAIGFAVIMGVGAKKDKRYKTGYKDNRTPTQIANETLELTEWLMIYGRFSLTVSAVLLLLIVLLIGSLDPNTIFGLITTYCFFLLLGWVYPVGAIITTGVRFMGMG